MVAEDARKLSKAKLKRKASSQRSSSSKRIKASFTSVEGLPWKTVSKSVGTGLDGDDGILELEEVDDVEVVYENTDRGQVVKFNVLQKPDGESPGSDEEPAHDHPSPSLAIEADESQSPQLSTFDSAALLPDWHHFNLHPHILQVLHSRKFNTPTPIQSKAISPALSGRDVIGVAETGSGKTLAYGLPIIHHILSLPRPPTKRRELQALILAPTRELALQVSVHLNVFSKAVNGDVKEEPEEVYITSSESPSDKRGVPAAGQHGYRVPLVSVAVLVGGMSAQRQRRVLDRTVDVIVATPGRLWDILQEDEALANQIRRLRFLVLDEADRMIEAGHFEEMDKILRLTRRQSKQNEIEPECGNLSDIAEQSTRGPLQTFVFSATLSKELQRNLKKRSRHKGGKKGDHKPLSTLDDLLLRLDFRDPQPDVIDISPSDGTVSTLQLSRLECLSSDKDVYLYYFLLRYPGRSLVFLSAIDGIRRLLPLLELLNLKAFPLHSQLEQRQRLKNLDRFKSTPKAVLLATDIAARGLDIPAVDHVIHYQIPRSADVFVHRNGRTARAMQKGFSLLMCSPEERRVVRSLLAKLGRREDDLPAISVEMTMLDDLKARIHLARQIDLQQHNVKKQNHERHWLKDTAEAMDIELDPDFVRQAVSPIEVCDYESNPSRYQKRRAETKTASLKAELRELLSKPLLARGASTKYITFGSRPIADDLLEGNAHETMLGLKRTDAGDDLVAAKTKKPAKVKKGKEGTRGVDWRSFLTLRPRCERHHTRSGDLPRSPSYMIDAWRC
ncbi:ATP-dependent RNA helicase [Pisolithus marmoratus]|nr:ATP-dependent RNA helicase [Pisolithus marmoratus]